MGRHSNTLRIIGGEWRGRKLNFPDARGLRPSHDRVRETLFNWLAADIEGAKVLDLFAGSGSLGLEALSRGAKQVTFVEKERKVAQAISQHLQTLNASNGVVKNWDAFKALTILPPQSVDLLFLDPPFERGFLPKLLTSEALNQLLKPEALIYIEAESSLDLSQCPWEEWKVKKTSSLSYGLYQKSVVSEGNEI